MTADRRTRPYRRSRLDRFRPELLALRDCGATAAEIRLWLRDRRVKVAPSTVTRWLRGRGDPEFRTASPARNVPPRRREPFRAAEEAAALRARTRDRRKRRYRRSRLDRHWGELLAMRDRGDSAADLGRWLREHRIKVSHSTVLRWLAKRGTA